MTQLPLSYKDAALVIKKVSSKKGSVKSCISQINHQTNIKLVYALVYKVLKNINEIQKIIEQSKLQVEFDPFLAQVLVADLLYGKGLNHIANVPVAQQIIASEKQLRECFERITNEKQTKTKREKKSKVEMKEELLIRYVRVNLIKTTLEKTIKMLEKNDFEQIEYERENIKFSEFKELVDQLKSNQFIIDYHFANDLLIFHLESSSKLKELKFYEEGKMIFQDKASLMAIECLDLKPGMRILDVCCAPGMKTAAIASRLNNEAEIISIDKDAKRLGEMENILEKAGVTCCEMHDNDFIDVNPEEVGPVDVIMLDPSCSGTGMIRRLEYHHDEHTDKKRLYKLASFQTKMLTHAMKFATKRIVYSTCSVSVLENEFVIKSALKESTEKFNYKIVNALPNWESRGLGDFNFAIKCIRSSEKDLTNGFFVCVLERDA